MVMKILITGSAGMLGTELCKVLGKENEIVGLDVVRLKTTDVRLQTFYEASVTDAEEIKKIFDREKPDLIIHAAAFTDVDGCEKESEKAYEINVRGTQNIAQTASRGETPVTAHPHRSAPTRAIMYWGMLGRLMPTTSPGGSSPWPRPRAATWVNCRWTRCRRSSQG